MKRAEIKQNYMKEKLVLLVIIIAIMIIAINAFLTMYVEKLSLEKIRAEIKEEFSQAADLSNIQSPLTYSHKKAISHCNAISDDSERQWYRCFAGIFTDISQCQNIMGYIDEYNVDIGEDRFTTDFCHSLFAVKHQDYRICGDTEGMFASGVCLGALAFYKDDASICDNAIKLEREKEQGIRQKESCLHGFAVRRKDSEVCKLIKDNEILDECIIGVRQ